MSRSIFDLKNRRITLYPPNSGESLEDMRLFLERLHESVNETPNITMNEDSLELRLEDAPKVWHLLNALRTDQVDVAIYRNPGDKNYIRLGKPGPAN